MTIGDALIFFGCLGVVIMSPILIAWVICVEIWRELR